MDIGSFETSAFNRRQLEKMESMSKSPWANLKQIAFMGLVIAVAGFLWSVLTGPFAISPLFGNVLTPNRFLVLLTISLIGITPILKRKKFVTVSDVSPGVTRLGGVSREVIPANPMTPTSSIGRRGSDSRMSPPQYVDMSIPTRFDSSTLRRAPASPAPFVDDIHSVQRHEFSDLLPVWARKFEDMIVMPHIIVPLVEALRESDRILSEVFIKFGFRLDSSNSASSHGVVCLSDRFLPNPMCTVPEITALWNRRLTLENLLNIPSFSPNREYVVERICAWSRGIRYAYRPDFRSDESGPTDSHILSHLIFVSFDSQMGSNSSFQEQFVVTSATSKAGGGIVDEFQSLFGRGSIRGQQSRVAWLEQSNTNRGLHYNVGTHQKVYGVPAGGGNLIEALCLLFHLIRKLSPTTAWMQIPHEVRIALESIVITGPTGGLVTGLSVGRPAISCYKGF